MAALINAPWIYLILKLWEQSLLFVVFKVNKVWICFQNWFGLRKVVALDLSMMSQLFSLATPLHMAWKFISNPIGLYISGSNL